MNPEFFAKLAKNPKLLKAFQNPQYMQALQEMGKDPKAAMAKCKNGVGKRHHERGIQV